MPRTTADSTPPGGHLAPAASGYLFPPGASLPGQTVVPSAANRAWPTLAELLNALKRRLVLATFLGLLVGMAAAAAVWLALPAGKHQVRGLLQVRPAPTILEKNAQQEDFDAFKQNTLRLIKTDNVLRLVVTDPAVNRLGYMQGLDEPVRFLDEAVRLRWDAPELLAVSMTGDDPASLKVIIDTLMTVYLNEAKSDSIRVRQKNKATLEGMLQDLQKKIEYREERMRKLAKMGSGAGVGTNQAVIQMLSVELNGINTAILALQTDNRRLQGQLEVLQKRLTEIDRQPIDAVELERAVKDNPAVAARIADRDRQQQRVAKMLETYQKGAAPLVAAQEELVKLEAAVKAETEALRPAAEKAIRENRRLVVAGELAAVKTQIEVNEATIRTNQADKTKLEQRRDGVLAGSVETAIEQEDLTPMKAQRAMIQEQLMTEEMKMKDDARIVLRENAVVILNQNLKQKALIAIAAFFAGGAIIFLGVAFLEWRSRRVDSVEQVVNELGLRVIGTIPAFPSKQSLKSGDAAHSQNWRFVLNESVNSARTMLLHTAKTQNMQVLMVSSAMQGEGKTSLASQLGTSMATAGLRTLILDCDLRNPSMHKLFDVPLTPGCSEVLCQEVDVSDVVQPTTVPNLWLIPAGQCSNRVISALAQGHPLETLFNRLRGQFDFIVVDSCPILPVADALLVGQHVDGVVISVLQDISQLPKVMTASEKLTQLNIPLLGTVVNGIKPDVHAYGYNYVKQLPA
jgi:capsular exopolysaccharide synthesis family protein